MRERIFERPLPRMTLDAMPYWEGARDHKLLYQICDGCGSVVFHPRCACPYCLSDSLRWAQSRGRGKVYSYSVIYRPPYEAWAAKVPYAVGIVELDEGFYMFTEIIHPQPEQIRIGMPVEVVFDKVTDEVTLPKFVSGASGQAV